MQKSLTKKDIQMCISALENVFFREDATPVNFKKLDIDLHTYDAGYENNVRRKELNLIILLEEMLYSSGEKKVYCSQSLFSIEKILFSSELYRSLIFDSKLSNIIKQFKTAISHLESECDIFNSKIDNDLYARAVKKLEFLSPPASKKLFLKDMSALVKSLKERSLFLTNF